ncbi:GNAT family N-acetyltransferase [Enterococcus hirae]|uniref:GNAT family N-acetyltransferase n=1 Tax=Enterococcus hirae TaxID=1354 RepID=UPI00254376EA|nr:GNAT family N-acetyltransferase [Enterococcus hirae]EMF0085651.1 GNAT family N-acetyltransferase [Enterococcus hirae]MDK4468430.1 GNAT family N-acetyltransferase [Enterococcus hirae]
MSEEISLTIREAQPNDASELLAMMQQVEEETDFLVMDEKGMELTPEALALSIEYLQDSNNNLLLLACMGQKIIGVVSVKTGEQYRISHVGEVGISILKDYWGLGLGTMLLEEVLIWVKENGVLFRLELDVQTRNERAVHLYQKMGFEIEALMKRGARTDDGDFLDVYRMSLLID